MDEKRKTIGGVFLEKIFINVFSLGFLFLDNLGIDRSFWSYCLVLGSYR